MASPTGKHVTVEIPDVVEELNKILPLHTSNPIRWLSNTFNRFDINLFSKNFAYDYFHYPDRIDWLFDNKTVIIHPIILHSYNYNIKSYGNAYIQHEYLLEIPFEYNKTMYYFILRGYKNLCIQPPTEFFSYTDPKPTPALLNDWLTKGKLGIPALVKNDQLHQFPSISEILNLPQIDTLYGFGFQYFPHKNEEKKHIITFKWLTKDNNEHVLRMYGLTGAISIEYASSKKYVSEIDSAMNTLDRWQFKLNATLEYLQSTYAMYVLKTMIPDFRQQIGNKKGLSYEDIVVMLAHKNPNVLNKLIITPFIKSQFEETIHLGNELDLFE